MTNGKFYWLKLKKDFFKRHDIRIIRKLPNGNDIILLYLILLLESTDHEGELRFNDEIPYSAEMLAAITDIDVEITKQAIEVLTNLKLYQVKDDGTIILEKFSEMVGCETQWAEKKRTYRGQKEDSSRTSKGQKRTLSDKSIEIRDKRLEIRDKRHIDIFAPPTVEEVANYCESRHNTINPQLFVDYYQSKGWLISNGCKMRDWRAAVRSWENNEINYRKGENDI